MFILNLLIAVFFLFAGYALVQLGLQQRTTARVWGYALLAAGATSLLAGMSMLFG